MSIFHVISLNPTCLVCCRPWSSLFDVLYSMFFSPVCGTSCKLCLVCCIPCIPVQCIAFHVASLGPTSMFGVLYAIQTSWLNWKLCSDDDVSLYNSTASTRPLATPRTTWESIIFEPRSSASVFKFKLNYFWIL